MANNKSAEKRNRQNAVRNARNTHIRSSMRTFVKQVRVAVANGDAAAAKEALAKAMQRACGTGGTVKDGRIEIQGDRRETVAKILTEAGFRPVFAGG